MEMDEDVLEKTHQGCSWNIFHALCYHYSQTKAKKRFSYRKHYLPKHSKGTGRQRTRLFAYDSEDSRSIPVSPNTRKSSSTKKRSLRSRFRSLISRESPKKLIYKEKVSESSKQPRFQRTYSIHHLESSEYVSQGSIQVDSEVNKLKNQEYNGKLNLSGNKHVSKKYEAEEETGVDILEIYRVNKDLFSKVLKYTDGGIAKSFCNLETREAREKLTRSGSYPSPKSSQLFRVSNLDHKQNEIWSVSKFDKLFPNIQPRVVDGTTKYSRRTLSLNESPFARHAHLLPKSSIGEPKLSSSKSLNLKNESLYIRVRSLSRIDSYGFYQNETSCDGHSMALVAEGDLDRYKNVENRVSYYEDLERDDKTIQVEQVSNLAESINKRETAKVPKTNEKIEEQIVLKDSKKEEDIDLTEVSEEKLPNSFLVVQSDLKDDATSLTNILAYKDFECETSFCVEDSPVNPQRESCSKSLSRSISISSKICCNNVEKSELLINSYNDFEFVREILDRSGFSRNGLPAPWYSLDQPLNPSVFDEVEAFWPHEDLCPKDDLCANHPLLFDDFCCHHQLLFNLVNEVLVQIHDTSFTYYPKALSSNCRVSPMPVKCNVLDEVWGKISKIMNKNLAGSDQKVEGIIAQDIGSDKCWMNLQLESECKAIDLGDMLLDELLEELLYS